MKKMFFILLFAPLICFAQQDKFADAFFKLKPDSNAKLVSLPRLARSDFYKIYEAGVKSHYTYVVNADSAYYRIFSRYSKDSLPAFDFNKHELAVNIYCSQCLVSCNHEGWDYQPCHRNACRYHNVWYVRDK